MQEFFHQQDGKWHLDMDLIGIWILMLGFVVRQENGWICGFSCQCHEFHLGFHHQAIKKKKRVCTWEEHEEEGSDRCGLFQGQFHVKGRLLYKILKMIRSVRPISISRICLFAWKDKSKGRIQVSIETTTKTVSLPKVDRLTIRIVGKLMIPNW